MIDEVTKSQNRQWRRSLTDIWKVLGGYDNTLAKKYLSQSKQDAMDDEHKL